MTSVLSCVLATIALAADPSSKGLPFGVPPAAEDAAISRVAPPQCLFYVDWTGTAAPSASSTSETEKLLAEPEVQEFLGALNKVIGAYLRKQDGDAKKAATATVAPQPLVTPPPPWPASTGGSPPSAPSPEAGKGHKGYTSGPATPVLTPPSAANPYAKPGATVRTPTPPTVVPVPPPKNTPTATVKNAAADPPEVLVRSADPLRELPIKLPPEKPKFSVSAEDYGDWLGALLTHPTAIFIEEIKAASPVKEKRVMGPPGSQQPQAKGADASSVVVTEQRTVSMRGGMVVSLGSDAPRLLAKFQDYLRKAKKADVTFEQIRINDETWYRYTPPKPGDQNRVTFGFHGDYFVVGLGEKMVEGILARWNSPAPAWLAKAREQTPVPRRTGIIYLNLKALREKLLPLAPSPKDTAAVLELLGLGNVDSLVSTTGLEDQGMINRVLLATDGKPHGLLDMVADRPLEAKDLAPIPDNAMLALAARVDLDRTFKVIVSAYEKAGGGKDADVQKAVDQFKQEYRVDLRRLLSAVGDTWCLYNSPAEGEMVFLGWTAVVAVRDRAALVDNWEKLLVPEKKKTQTHAAKDKGGTGDVTELVDSSPEFRKSRFAGQEIYYLAGQPIAPAFCVTDHELVMTLSMPAMKAYLARKNHRSLAVVPGVALALNDRNRPAALGYCDTPRVFELLYPMFSMYSTVGAAEAQKVKIDLDPTFWPSAAAFRPHLRPDITTLQRTPQGLELTCRYCLPTGGANGPLYLIVMGSLGTYLNSPLPFVPTIVPAYAGDTTAAPTLEATPAPEQAVPPALPTTPVPPPGLTPPPPYDPAPANTHPTPRPAATPGYSSPASLDRPAESAPATSAAGGSQGTTQDVPNDARPVPKSPHVPKQEEDAFWNAKHYERLPVLGPIKSGTPDSGCDPPPEKAIMRALQKARPVQGGILFFCETQRKNVRIVSEPIQDSIDPPRVMPLVGPVQVHHVHYKCTVYFREVTEVRWPISSTTTDDDCCEVIYIDHDHLHRVAQAEDPAAVSPKK